MAGGPTVTLTFAGDSTKLDRAFGQVGESAAGMSRDVGRASDGISGSSSGLDRLGASADGAEGKFQGLGDVISGTGDVMTSFKEGDIVGMAGGLADMAGGIAAFVVPALMSMGAWIGTAATATWGFTAALLANPITWVVIAIIALIAAIVLLIVYWDQVAAVVGVVVDWIVGRWNWVMAKLGAVGAFIKSIFSDAWRWVQDRASALVGWLAGLPGRVGRALSGMWDGLKWSFRSAINWLIGKWNNFSLGIGGFSFMGFQVPGFRIHTPNIPYFHQGGVVPGAPGSETLAMLQAGETVIPAGQGGTGRGSVVVSFHGDVDSAFATAFMKLVRTGKIQIGG
ncbi:MAG: hypothetical protein L0H64_13715 [Pseudonocardia sp.]|nr:hypothetical protein [Pseudonocardia sp.]